MYIYIYPYVYIYIWMYPYIYTYKDIFYKKIGKTNPSNILRLSTRFLS